MCDKIRMRAPKVGPAIADRLTQLKATSKRQCRVRYCGPSYATNGYVETPKVGPAFADRLTQLKATSKRQCRVRYCGPSYATEGYVKTPM
jgi:hypothetical protein